MLLKSLLNIKTKVSSNAINQIKVRNASQSLTVGFIGLGNMGSHMSRHLLEKGHRLVVYDINSNAMKALAEKGAITASSPAEVADKSDRIITMVPTGAHVLQVYCGPNGILSKAKSGAYLMDSSTIDPQTCKEVAQATQSTGAIFLDTPVTGAVPAARDGTLNFLVGGNENDVKVVEPLLLAMGARVFHCGPLGSAQVAKIVNNMCLAISMIGLSEGLNLAKTLGIDPKLMTEVLNAGSGRSWSSENYSPVPGISRDRPANNDYNGGFQSRLMTKDMCLAQTLALRANCAIPLGTLSHQLFRLMKNNNYAEKDFSSVYKFIQEVN